MQKRGTVFDLEEVELCYGEWVMAFGGDDGGDGGDAVCVCVLAGWGVVVCAMCVAPACL